MKFDFIKKMKRIFMIICKILILLAKFYSMWLIFECWKHDDFDDLESVHLFLLNICFDRLEVNHHVNVKSFYLMRIEFLVKFFSSDFFWSTHQMKKIEARIKEMSERCKKIVINKKSIRSDLW
jgi:hypothetical protein